MAKIVLEIPDGGGCAGCMFLNVGVGCQVKNGAKCSLFSMANLHFESGVNRAYMDIKTIRKCPACRTVYIRS